MKNLRDKIAIVGIGETEYERNSEKGPKKLILEAVQKAIDDAGMKPKDIDGVITEGRFVPPLMQHYELAYNLGFDYRYTAYMANSGAGNVGLPLLAASAIATGQADVIVTYFTNNYGTLRRKAYTYGDHGSPIKGSFENVYGLYGPPVHWAMRTNRYMHQFGLNADQMSAILGAIAVNQRRNAVLNGKGYMKKPITMEDYLKSPIVAEPLRLLDYTPVHDGACAMIMTSAERAKDCPHPPAYVMGAGFASNPLNDGDIEVQGEDYIFKPPEGDAFNVALKMAGIARKDIDFVEIYDAFTIMCLTIFEVLGFCKPGEGGELFTSGNAAIEGSLPINTNGGHLSHSYLFGATQLVEGVRQIRHEAGACQVKDAKIGLVSGGGGGTEGAAIILRRD